MSGTGAETGLRVGIVGAGLAGLAAATDLQAAGCEVVVWEKSRGAGGRTATRRGPDGMRFDHGAPYLHDGEDGLAGVPALAGHRLLLPDGTARDEVVGEVSANAPAKAMAARVEVRSGVRVGGISRAGTDAEANPDSGSGWRVTDEHGADLGRYDVVVVTAPAPQAAELLRSAAPELAAQAAAVTFDPCWAVMAAWDRPLDLPFTGVIGGQGLSVAIAEAPKPGRAPGERWVLQADAALSRELLEREAEEVGQLLLRRFAELAGSALPEPSHVAAHRWRYARPSAPLAVGVLRAGSLLAAGDWCGGGTAGDGVRSGRAAAAAVLA